MVKKEKAIEIIKKVLFDYIESEPESLLDITSANKLLCEAINELPEDDRWIPVSVRVPSDPYTSVLVQVTGRCGNFGFQDALLLAFYDSMCGWILESYPESEEFEVFAWHELPEPYAITVRTHHERI